MGCYTAWLKTQLSELRVAASEPDTFRFSRILSGDVYLLTFRRKPGSKMLTIEVSFEASPF